MFTFLDTHLLYHTHLSVDISNLEFTLYDLLHSVNNMIPCK